MQSRRRRGRLLDEGEGQPSQERGSEHERTGRDGDLLPEARPDRSGGRFFGTLGRRRAGCGTALPRQALRHPGGNLHAGPETELAPDLLDVTLRSALRDEQTRGNLPIRQTLSDKDCHLTLSAGETGRYHRDSRRSISTNADRLKDRYQNPVPIPVFLPMTAEPSLPSLRPQPR